MPSKSDDGKATVKKKKSVGIVAHTESDERSTKVQPTGDSSLDEVLSEPAAGATEDQIDVESPLGEDEEVMESLRSPSVALAEEDPEIEKSLAEQEKYAADIATEAELVEQKTEMSGSKTKTKDQKSETAAGEEASVKKPTKPSKSEKPATIKSAEPKRSAKVRSKKYLAAVKDLDLKATYPVDEALELVKKTSYTKFDGTVEAHIAVAAENQRGIITLPAGTGKERKVAAATLESIDDIVKQVEAGKINFDVLIAMPDVMAKLSKVARVLGPKGLMPNPKSGTVTTDVEKAKAEFAGGRVEYKQDKGGVVHQAIGKVSFTHEQLKSNLETLLHALPQPKITSLALTSTMGPGIKVKLS